jgi:hypothetical protein
MLEAAAAARDEAMLDGDAAADEAAVLLAAMVEAPAWACPGPPLRACSLSYTSRLSTASLSATRRVSYLARHSPSVEAH